MCIQYVLSPVSFPLGIQHIGQLSICALLCITDNHLHFFAESIMSQVIIRKEPLRHFDEKHSWSLFFAGKTYLSVSATTSVYLLYYGF